MRLYVFAVVIFAMTVLATHMGAGAVLAQTPDSPINLTLSPITLNLTTDPGSTTSATVKIRNNSTSTERLSVSIGTFEADETGQRPLMRDPRPEDFFLNWLSVDKQEVTIQPNEWSNFQVTFSPPPGAALSYYYTLQFNRTEVLNSPGSTVVQGAPALLVLTTVNSPNARPELQLESVKVAKPLVEFLPQEFILSIRNTGNVHLAPTGTVFLDGQNKSNVGILPINPNGNFILPGSTREFVVKWEDGFPVWQEGALTWDLTKAAQFRWGKYLGTVLLVYDNGQRDVPIESKVSFWVIPFRLLGGIVAVLVVPALLVYLLMRWQYSRRNKA